MNTFAKTRSRCTHTTANTVARQRVPSITRHWSRIRPTFLANSERILALSDSRAVSGISLLDLMRIEGLPLAKPAEQIETNAKIAAKNSNTKRMSWHLRS
eukprot:Amastigsp_a339616_2070.p5 type:complete len:100 gc:universal Amastigsp_a339616_2070:1172-1471(+)